MTVLLSTKTGKYNKFQLRKMSSENRNSSKPNDIVINQAVGKNYDSCV